MRLRGFLLAAAALTAGLLAATAGIAQDQAAKGREVFVQWDERRNEGFDDFTSRQIMVLRNEHGEESRRVMRQSVLNGAEGEGDKVLIVFEEPKDVRGTALLTHGHIGRDDDQWLYLPTIKRVKRISGATQAGSFLGSEFAYEDLKPQEVEDYTYAYLGEDTIDGRPMHKVERRPVDEDSGYTRQVTWLDKEAYRLQKVDFYDRKNVLLKTMTLDDYRSYLDGVWREHEVTVINHQTGKSTDLSIDDYRFDTGLAASDFTRTSLRRAR